jgi:hypothetical protein
MASLVASLPFSKLLLPWPAPKTGATTLTPLLQASLQALSRLVPTWPPGLPMQGGSLLRLTAAFCDGPFIPEPSLPQRDRTCRLGDELDSRTPPPAPSSTSSERRRGGVGDAAGDAEQG